MGAARRSSARLIFSKITSCRYIEILPAPAAALLMIGFAYYGLDSPRPPGLYLEMARAIEQAGYALPTTVPHYTAGGIPFAYPPLAFYLMAFFKDVTHLSYLDVAVVMTWVEYVLFGLASALFARTLFRERSRWHTVVASTLIVVTPAVYLWQLRSPEASVRLLGMIFLTGGLSYGLRLFRDNERSARVPAIALFAGTILSHPTYIPMFGVSYLIMYFVYDRSVTGLLWGAMVAIGGILVTSPWWGLIIFNHGIDIFSTAAGTHGGIGARTSPRALLSALTSTNGNFASLRMWTLATIGGLYCLFQRRWFLPVWIVTTSILFAPPRFIAFIEPLLVAVAVCEVVLPALYDHDLQLSTVLEFDRRTVSAVVVMALLLGAMGVGANFAYDNQKSGPTPAFYNATEWIEEETSPDATIVSYIPSGEGAFYSSRTVLNVPWGAEWEGPEAFARYKQQNDILKKCSKPTCLSQNLTSFGYDPDYVLAEKWQVNRSSFDNSPTYETVYSKDSIVIYSVRNKSTLRRPTD